MERVVDIAMTLLVMWGQRQSLDRTIRITTHAFNMVDFILAVKDFEKRLFLEKPIFYYPNTQVEVFYKKNKKKKKRECGTGKILLMGFYGACWFDFQIQLARFLPSKHKIIEINISMGNSNLDVFFLPRVFTPRIGRNHRCQLLTVDIKTGEALLENIRFRPNPYDPPIEEDLF